MLTVLVITRRLASDLRPIFTNVVGGVAKSAQSNAPAYAIAILFGLSASLSAFIDVFKELSASALSAMSWHQYATLWAKVLNPFIVAVLAYATQNKFRGGGIVSGPNGSASTTTPFPATQTSP